MNVPRGCLKIAKSGKFEISLKVTRKSIRVSIYMIFLAEKFRVTEYGGIAQLGGQDIR